MGGGTGTDGGLPPYSDQELHDLATEDINQVADWLRTRRRDRKSWEMAVWLYDAVDRLGGANSEHARQMAGVTVRALGNYESAAARLEDQLTKTPEDTIRWATVARDLAEVLSRQQQYERAEELLYESDRILREKGPVHELAATRYFEGRYLVRKGERKTGLDRLRRAYSLIEHQDVPYRLYGGLDLAEREVIDGDRGTGYLLAMRALSDAHKHGTSRHSLRALAVLTCGWNRPLMRRLARLKQD